MRSNRKFLLMAVLTASPSLLPAFAQVAPPPPKAPEKTPEFVPPAPTVQPAPRPAQNQPRARPGTAQPSGGQPQFSGPGSDLPDIPYESLVVMDEDGKVVLLNEPSAYAASRRNPTTSGPIATAELVHFIHERQQRAEVQVIENLDLVLEIESGFLRDMDWSDRAKYGQMAQRIRPLVVEPPFVKEAESRQILTRIQAGFQNKISREYDVAVMREARAAMSANSAEEAGPAMDTILQLSISEAMFAYDGLCRDVASNFKDVHAKLTLNAEQEVIVSGCNKALAGLEGEADKIDAVKKMIAALPLATAREALNATREIRPVVALPEIPPYQPLDGIQVYNTPEKVAAKRELDGKRVERSARELTEGIRPFKGEDGKTYFKNPDGTDREATAEELAAYAEHARKQAEEDKLENQRLFGTGGGSAETTGAKPADANPAQEQPKKPD